MRPKWSTPCKKDCGLEFTITSTSTFTFTFTFIQIQTQKCLEAKSASFAEQALPLAARHHYNLLICFVKHQTTKASTKMKRNPKKKRKWNGTRKDKVKAKMTTQCWRRLGWSGEVRSWRRRRERQIKEKRKRRSKGLSLRQRRLRPVHALCSYCCLPFCALSFLIFLLLPLFLHLNRNAMLTVRKKANKKQAKSDTGPAKALMAATLTTTKATAAASKVQPQAHRIRGGLQSDESWCSRRQWAEGEGRRWRRLSALPAKQSWLTATATATTTTTTRKALEMWVGAERAVGMLLHVVRGMGRKTYWR